MKLYMFAVRDTKAGFFHNPMFVRSEGEVRRMFADEVNRASQDNILYKHPGDFALFSLGTFDSTTGVIVSAALPEFVCEAASVVVAPAELGQLRSVN